jgi:uncharacterized lipoprotein
MLFVILVHALGCAYFQAAGEKNRVIQLEMDRYRYAQACQQVFPELRQALFEEGFQVRDSADGGMTVETEWARTNSDRDKRYLAQGIATDEGGCKIRVSFEQISSSGNRSSGRDYDMEMSILRRVNPDDHAEIMRKADAAYQSSVNES